MTRKVLHEENSRTALWASPAPREQSSKTFPQYLTAALATLSALAMGQCLSWTSPAIPMLQRNCTHIQITDEEGSWIGSVLTLGAFVGAIPAGTIAAKLGAKTTLQVLSIPMLLSWIFMAFSQATWYLYVGRILSGLAIGAISVAAPTYVAEIAEPKIRGTLGTFFQLQITIGLLLEFILGALVYDFRVFNLISAIVPIVFLISFSFMPHTPAYLLSNGDVSMARESLKRLRGRDFDVDEELTSVRDNIKESTAQKATFRDLLNCKASSRALIISLGLMIFQQLSGINAVLFYAKKIFKDSGGSLSSDDCTIIIGVAQVIATYFSTILIDRSGRRFLLLVSSSIMSVCLGALGLYFYLKGIYGIENLSFVPLVCIGMFIIVFSIGFGPIPWMMIGEIFPTKVKGIASSISASFNWMLAFTVTKCFQDMLDIFGTSWTFATFGIVCFFGTFFVYFVVPETKNKTHTEIQLLLLGKNMGCDVEIGNIDEDKVKM